MAEISVNETSQSSLTATELERVPLAHKYKVIQPQPDNEEWKQLKHEALKKKKRQTSEDQLAECVCCEDTNNDKAFAYACPVCIFGCISLGIGIWLFLTGLQISEKHTQWTHNAIHSQCIIQSIQNLTCQAQCNPYCNHNISSNISQPCDICNFVNYKYNVTSIGEYCPNITLTIGSVTGEDEYDTCPGNIRQIDDIEECWLLNCNQYVFNQPKTPKSSFGQMFGSGVLIAIGTLLLSVFCMITHRCLYETAIEFCKTPYIDPDDHDFYADQ